MKKYLNIFLFVTVLIFMAACGKEAGFGDEEFQGTGRLLTRSISLEVNGDEIIVRSGGNVPTPDEFTVDIKDANGTIVKSFRYKEMPEVVTLSVGTYTAVAHYGDNLSAGFDSPYYYGASKEFEVVKNRVTDSVDPIVCKLSNVKVSVLFDENLKKVMSSDSKVIVNVGNGTLEFSADETRDGYFAYVNESNSLTATFSGNVDGDETNETKTYNDVEPGRYYKITFRLHVPDTGETGDINPGSGDGNREVNVDATINITTVGDGGTNIDIEDEIMDDDRPNQGGGDDPTPPTPPDEPGKGPEITAELPYNLTLSGEDDKVNSVQEGNCIINISSKTGITSFMVNIESDSDSFKAAVGEMLGLEFDLINPGDKAAALSSLGLPVGDEVKNKGVEAPVKFDISQFIPILGGFPGVHSFILTVGDEDGTTIAKLIIKV